MYKINIGGDESHTLALRMQHHDYIWEGEGVEGHAGERGWDEGKEGRSGYGEGAKEGWVKPGPDARYGVTVNM